jgi:hypothetical protein
MVIVVFTEGIARLENIVKFEKCGGGVIGNASTSAVRRKYLDMRSQDAKAELSLLISLRLLFAINYPVRKRLHWYKYLTQ